MNESTENEKIALSSRLRHRAVGDDGVLVHLDNGRVIVVNEVGLHIVQQLASPRTKQELAESIASAFAVDSKLAEEATTESPALSGFKFHVGQYHAPW